MSIIKYKVTLLFFLFFSVLSLASNDVASDGKVLIISSYGPDYRWSNIMIDEIGLKVKKVHPGTDINVEYLSSELFINTEVWVDRINLILQNYSQENPKLIILISDEAWIAFRQAQRDGFEDVPLVLCAVKPHSIELNEYINKRDSLTLEDFSPTVDVMKKYNATGVIRRMNVTSYVELMDNTIPDIDNYVLITDARFYGIYTRLVFEEYLVKNKNKKPVKYLDARFLSTETLFEELQDISPNTGLLMTSWLTGKVGFDYSREFVYKEMVAELKAPIFITNDIGLSTGNFVGGYFSSSTFWAEKSAGIILDILKGQSPQQIAPQEYLDQQCRVNWAVLAQFGLLEEKFPEHTIYINQPVSLLKQYKEEFVLVLVFISLVFLGFVFVIRSNIKLKHAKEVAHGALLDYYKTNKDLVNTQESLKQALEKAEAADRLKSAFISNMDNEIRTPLNNIVGFANQLPELEDKEDTDQAITQIIENSEQLLCLIMNILDFSQIEAGVLNFVSEDIDPDSVCRDVVNVFSAKKKPSVELCFKKPDDHFNITSDTRRVVQILSIFVDNAVKFTREGKIEVGYFSVGEDKVEFYVKDTGIGISEEGLSLVFDRFYKADQYSCGSGLGLSISKKIIEILGAEIGVSSQIDVGSRFWFRIKKS